MATVSSTSGPAQPNTGSTRQARFAEASELYQLGQAAKARPILETLLQEDPDDNAARYGLALCLLSLGCTFDAEAHLLELLDGAPDHYLAAYELGRLRQSTGDLHGAADAFRRVLAVTPHHDTAERLQQCLGDRPNPVASPADIGRTLHELLEARRPVERGEVVMSVQRRMRWSLTELIGGALQTILWVALAVGLWPINAILSAFSVILGFAILALTCIAVRGAARLNTAEIYEHGLEIKSGVVRRHMRFIWFYQITESPIYVRTLKNLITNTASMVITFNETGPTSVRQAHLLAMGNPREVQQLRRFLESRIPTERQPLKGPWL
jgi:tetratricopeptide (TPR) repeat protein